jgi:hypothetical protein
MSALLGGTLALLLAVQAPATRSHLVVVTGLGGEPGYRRALQEWSASLVGAGRKLGIADSDVVQLAGDSGATGAAGAGVVRATRENVASALRELARRSSPGDVVLLFLAGHGSHEGAESRLNIPGPDMTAAELAALLRPLADRRLVVVNAASASGDYIAALSAPGRIVITATKTSLERNATQFGRHFAAAYGADGADADKDGRVSVLEAYLYAKRETARAYTSDNRLLTEHAMLDDNGDKAGSSAPGAEGADGALARSLYLAAAPVSYAAGDTASAAMDGEKRVLETRIAELRGRKASMKAEEYEARLEALLVELALKNEALRARSTRP